MKRALRPDATFLPIPTPEPVEIPEITDAERMSFSFRLKAEKIQKAIKKQNRQLGVR